MKVGGGGECEVRAHLFQCESILVVLASGSSELEKDYNIV